MIKSFLRRWPRLYHVLQRGYYGTLYWTERGLLGSRIHELMWRYRRFDEFGTARPVHPHRTWLVERLKRRPPFSSVLEIGCSAGANLRVLSAEFPGIRLHGVDVNGRAVAEVQRMAREGRLPSTTASAGRADELQRFGDGTFDIALADATLMYVGPDKIDAALREMVRVAGQAIVVNDWNLYDPRGPEERSRWFDAHWVHDYERLLRANSRVRSISVEKVPVEVWGGSGWQEYGALIQAELEPPGRAT